jgi:hypothetical protein
MNSLLLFVNSATQNSHELLPLLMTKLAVGLAIFSMLFFINRTSYRPNKTPETNTNS